MRRISKKSLKIAVAVLLLAVLTVVLILSNLPRCPALISRKERDQLMEDYHMIYGGNFTEHWYSEGTAGHSYENCRIYGKDNGYILFFTTKGAMKKHDGLLIVDGLKFKYREPFSLCAYKDGQFFEIADAYEKGFISDEALKKAQEYHNGCQEEKEFLKWW